jgi:hypothetical protein
LPNRAQIPGKNRHLGQNKKHRQEASWVGGVAELSLILDMTLCNTSGSFNPRGDEKAREQSGDSPSLRVYPWYLSVPCQAGHPAIIHCMGVVG